MKERLLRPLPQFNNMYDYEVLTEGLEVRVEIHAPRGVEASSLGEFSPNNSVLRPAYDAMIQELVTRGWANTDNQPLVELSYESSHKPLLDGSSLVIYRFKPNTPTYYYQ